MVKAKQAKTNHGEKQALGNLDEKEFLYFNEMKSWSSFGIRNEILAALYDKQFFDPTEIQRLCLGPAISGKRDILGAAETGSGKTLAFGIPIVNGILNCKEEEISEHKDVVDEE